MVSEPKRPLCYDNNFFLSTKILIFFNNIETIETYIILSLAFIQVGCVIRLNPSIIFRYVDYKRVILDHYEHDLIQLVLFTPLQGSSYISINLVKAPHTPLNSYMFVYMSNCPLPLYNTRIR